MTDVADDIVPDRVDERAGLLGGSLALTGGRIISLVINMVVQVAIVRYLTKDSFASFALGLALVASGQTIAQLGLDRAISRFVPIYHEEGDGARLLGVVTAVASAATVLGVLFALFGPLVFVGDGGVRSVVAVLLWLTPLEALKNAVVLLLAAFGRARVIVLRVSILDPAAKLAAVGIVVASGGDAVDLAVWYVVAALVGLAASAWMAVSCLRDALDDCRLVGQPRVVRPLVPWRTMLAYCVPLLTSDLVFTVVSSSDALMLEAFGHHDGVAEVRAVLPLARLCQIVLLSFGTMYTPQAVRVFMRDGAAQLSSLYWQTTAVVAALTTPVVVAVMVLSDELSGGLFGEAYASSSAMLVVLTIGFGANALVGPNGVTLNALGLVGRVAAGNGAAVVANVLLNLLLIPRYGAMGAVWGTALSMMAHNAVRQLLLMRVEGIEWPRRPVALLLLGAMSGVGALALVQLTFDVPLVGRILGGVVVIAAVLGLASRAIPASAVGPLASRSRLARTVLRG